MKIVEVIEIDGGLGFILPEDFVEKLHADKNDCIGYIELPNGFELVPYAPESIGPIETPDNQESPK